MSTNTEYPGQLDSINGRRRFVTGVSALGGAQLLGMPLLAAAEPPPETTRISLFEGPPTCLAPQYVAQDLLHAEGFSDVRYVKFERDTKQWPPDVVISGEADLCFSFPPQDIAHIDAGAPVVVLAGIHSGCVEVVGGAGVRSTLELKGKKVSVSELGSDEHIFISMFAAYVGLDPRKDINWVVNPHIECVKLLMEGKIDAFFCGPPQSLEMRQKKIGHVLVSTTVDKPWSHHTCCLVASNKDFVRKHPVATKRALRALLKATDICAAQPARAAQIVTERGWAPYNNNLQMLRELPYGKWREFDPEDALRFYALRMRELGMVKAAPNKIIAEGTDWRFLNELKKELKA